MSSRFFLDTNIFVYSFDRTAPEKARRAAQLIRRALTTGEGVISFQVAQEFFNVALRRFDQNMAVSEAELYLATVFRPLMAVQSSPALYQEALRLNAAYSLSWYDSLIVAAALEAGCSVLHSEDLQDEGKFGKLRVENPFN